MLLAAGIALLVGAHAPINTIEYRMELRDSRHIMAAPIVIVMDHQNAMIKTEQGGRTIIMKVTPEIKESNQIQTTLEMTVTDMDKKTHIGHKMIMSATYVGMNGETSYIMCTPSAQGGCEAHAATREKPKRRLIRGEMMISITPTIGTGE